MRLKIEINTREHFNILGLQEFPFKVGNSWFSGECNITTYKLEELLGTKLRALYQRRKGRDLFDLYWAFTHKTILSVQLLRCYREYMNFSVAQPPTSKTFLANMEVKMKDIEFSEGMETILRPGIAYDYQQALKLIKDELIERI